MIRINLLPVRQIRKKQRLLKEVAVFGLVLVVLAASLTLFGMSLGRQVGELHQQIGRLNHKKATYNRLLAELRQMKKKKELIDKKIATIRKLKKDSQLGARVLDQLASRTPTERVWLTSLKYSPNRLVISGVALDNATIAQYMDQLTASPYFANVDLASSSLKVVAGNNLKSFSMAIRITQPTAPKQSAAEGAHSS